MQLKTIVVLAIFGLLLLCKSNDPVTPPIAKCPDPVTLTDIKLLTPNGCENFKVGDTVRITWTPGAFGGVKATFYPNGGKSKGFVIKTVNTQDTLFAKGGPIKWEIPPIIIGLGGFDTIQTISDQCYIQVVDYSKEQVSDISDVMFRITGL